MASENGSANASANHPGNGPSSSSWTTPRSSSIFNEAATLINRGGLGSSAHSQTRPPPPSTTTTQTTPSHPQELNAALDIYERQFQPGQPKSLSGIAIRSFLLGLTLSSTLVLALYLLTTHQPLWRAPFFITTLSLFHFLEFYTTSRANTSSAQISSFLFSSNGSAYTIAHSTSFLETLLSHYFLPAVVLPLYIHYPLLILGLGMIVIGQTTRAVAMLTAGTNFSHVVKHTKAQSHQLVTTGIYSVLRHPSYFGFFWWGIGTQLVCGNVFSLLGYAGVLWKFFERRIDGEEELLVRFFGDEYRDYRKRTRVGIPFIK
ncbi:farnesyl cysteine-carboxyl methyltransferase [Rhexocercosporidium sp. MPI-PUGE-AT-0058]|nr:farnesyl cysteine-carboxyl methyltransferase [Rhexocercosporidium sp. MPI-PUGE-AT-0058]